MLIGIYNNSNNNNNNNNNNIIMIIIMALFILGQKQLLQKNDLIKNIYTISNSYKICITKMCIK